MKGAGALVVTGVAGFACAGAEVDRKERKAVPVWKKVVARAERLWGGERDCSSVSASACGTSWCWWPNRETWPG